MIRTQRQLNATLDQIKHLANALQDAGAIAKPDVLVKAHITSLETDIAAMEDEVRQYEALLKGRFNPAPLQAIGNLGQDLIRARIACKLTHKELAKAVGKKEQAIQRLEASDYKSASLATLTSIANTIMSMQRGKPTTSAPRR